jgi:hypothetical protein
MNVALAKKYLDAAETLLCSLESGADLLGFSDLANSLFAVRSDVHAAYLYLNEEPEPNDEVPF